MYLIEVGVGLETGEAPGPMISLLGPEWHYRFSDYEASEPTIIHNKTFAALF